MPPWGEAVAILREAAVILSETAVILSEAKEPKPTSLTPEATPKHVFPATASGDLPNSKAGRPPFI